MRESIRCWQCNALLAKVVDFIQGCVEIKCRKCGAFTTKRANASPDSETPEVQDEEARTWPQHASHTIRRQPQATPKGR
ncbi:MAG: Com family DNA-binding transcriptional regulator [Rhodospirillaceae bacterium]